MLEFALCMKNADEAHRAKAMLLRRLEELRVAGEIRVFTESDALLDSFAGAPPSFLLIDTAFSGGRGLPLAEALRARGALMPIAFVSEQRALALPCFKVHPSGFFLKPFTYPQLCGLLDWHKGLVSEGAAALRASVERVPRSIFLFDLLYVTVSGRTATFCTTSGELCTNRALARIEDELTPFGFARCSRNAIVNLDRIKVLNKNAGTLTLSDGSCVPLTAERVAEMTAALRERRRRLDEIYRA